MTLKHSNQLQACCRFLPCIDSVRNTAETLASYAKKTHVGWVCFPKIATLANLAGVSLRTAKYHLKKLVELGVITISHRHYICKKPGAADRPPAYTPSVPVGSCSSPTSLKLGVKLSRSRRLITLHPQIALQDQFLSETNKTKALLARKIKTKQRSSILDTLRPTELPRKTIENDKLFSATAPSICKKSGLCLKSGLHDS
ncbi:helix-turn-helix domain-containing protein [Edwardsiella piscicida]|nr:helix-turn-helix domain-containing protein [Edwardsiella piscicida]